MKRGACPRILGPMCNTAPLLLDQVDEVVAQKCISVSSAYSHSGLIRYAETGIIQEAEDDGSREGPCHPEWRDHNSSPLSVSASRDRFSDPKTAAGSLARDAGLNHPNIVVPSRCQPILNPWRGRCQLLVAAMWSISAWQASVVFRELASILVVACSKATLRS